MCNVVFERCIQNLSRLIKEDRRAFIHITIWQAILNRSGCVHSQNIISWWEYRTEKNGRAKERDYKLMPKEEKKYAPD